MSSWELPSLLSALTQGHREEVAVAEGPPQSAADCGFP